MKCDLMDVTFSQKSLTKSGMFSHDITTCPHMTSPLILTWHHPYPHMTSSLIPTWYHTLVRTRYNPLSARDITLYLHMTSPLSAHDITPYPHMASFRMLTWHHPYPHMTSPFIFTWHHHLFSHGNTPCWHMTSSLILTWHHPLSAHDIQPRLLMTSRLVAFSNPEGTGYPFLRLGERSIQVTPDRLDPSSTLLNFFNFLKIQEYGTLEQHGLNSLFS